MISVGFNPLPPQGLHLAGTSLAFSGHPEGQNHVSLLSCMGKAAVLLSCFSLCESLADRRTRAPTPWNSSSYPCRSVRFKMSCPLSLTSGRPGEVSPGKPLPGCDLCFMGAWGSDCLQHRVYKAEGLPVPPAQQAVGQSEAVFSGGAGERKAWRTSGESLNVPRGCLAKWTLEKVKKDVELRFKLEENKVLLIIIINVHIALCSLQTCSPVWP